MHYNQSITFQAKSGHITGVGIIEIKTVTSNLIYLWLQNPFCWTVAAFSVS
jgi:hypothetical protein